MSDNPKGTERNAEIVSFFYLIFSNRIHQGMDQDSARKEAYDAVTLRYGIGKGRLLNIISQQKSSREVNRVAMRQNARNLIDELRTANGEMDSAKERNEKLISLLEEHFPE